MTQRPGTGREPLRIVIVGGGLAGWYTAAALGRALHPDDRAITVLDEHAGDPDRAAFGVAAATLPGDPASLAAGGIDEDSLIRGTHGAFTLGIALSGWSGEPAPCFHPFGATGVALGSVSFYHLALRLRREGMPLRLANYSLAALAAQAGRFARPDDNSHPALSTCAYGLHVHCDALAALCRDAARQRNVTTKRDTLGHVELDAGAAIAAVVTGTGERLAGDLFVDCTGQEARVIRHCGIEWQDWSAWLPCDRVLHGYVEERAAPPACSHASAHTEGWQHRVPLAGGAGLSDSYRSGARSDDAACVRPGRRLTSWQSNCIAIGSSAAFVDPVAAGNLQLLDASVNYLCGTLPASRDMAAEAAEYNRLLGLYADNVRDFAILHYKLNGRHGEPLWDECRAMPVPDSLAYRIALYESRGRVALYDEEPLPENSWINLFDEHGVVPRQYNPIADGMDSSDIRQHVERLRAILIEALAGMPAHGDYLAGLGNDTGARRNA